MARKNWVLLIIGLILVITLLISLILFLLLRTTNIIAQYPVCRLANLEKQVYWENLDGVVMSWLYFINKNERPCHLVGYPELYLKNVKEVAMRAQYSRATLLSKEPVYLDKANAAAVSFVWSNWCLDTPQFPLTINLRLPSSNQSEEIAFTNSKGKSLDTAPICYSNTMPTQFGYGAFAQIAISQIKTPGAEIITKPIDPDMVFSYLDPDLKMYIGYPSSLKTVKAVKLSNDNQLKFNVLDQVAILTATKSTATGLTDRRLWWGDYANRLQNSGSLANLCQILPDCLLTTNRNNVTYVRVKENVCTQQTGCKSALNYYIYNSQGDFNAIIMSNFELQDKIDKSDEVLQQIMDGLKFI